MTNQDKHYGLSVRTKHCLLNSKYCDATKEQLREAYFDGKVRPKFIRNYGRKSHLELLQWLGISEVKLKPLSFSTNCPHCWKPLKLSLSKDNSQNTKPKGTTLK